MALSPGARLGSYEVVAPLGAGGLGQVYRARDRKLGRDVALKMLPQALTADADRLARLEREAKVLASLNHPTSARSTGSAEVGDSLPSRTSCSSTDAPTSRRSIVLLLQRGDP
jgi:serine/threonine protein kinase